LASPEEVTELLLAWSNGEEEALNRLIPIVYDELRRIARRHMDREDSHHILQTTALVNETYMRLVDLKRMRWESRAHFFALASRLMRRILVDFARSREYLKRGAGIRSVRLDDAPEVGLKRDPDLVALNDALETLFKMDPRKEQVVEMRFFGGLSIEESALVLKVSPETVRRDWRLAKVWLLRELSAEERDAG
jgi:RNA polymerase sigma factor (TIGR02999 family)